MIKSRSKRSLFDSLKAELKTRQSPARYAHSLAVAAFAAQLGKRHGWPPERARLAGLLHDWAKEWKPKQLIRHARRHRLPVPELSYIARKAPNLAHAYVSADVAKRAGWIRNRSDLNAIASHTLGSLSMGTPEKILYVADLASPDRKFKEAPSIRRLAMENLKLGFAAALSLKLEYQLRKRKVIHPLPVQVWNKLVCGVRLP